MWQLADTVGGRLVMLVQKGQRAGVATLWVGTRTEIYLNGQTHALLYSELIKVRKYLVYQQNNHHLCSLYT